MKRSIVIVITVWTIITVGLALVYAVVNSEQDFSGFAFLYGYYVWLTGLVLGSIVYVLIYLLKHFTDPSVSTETRRGTLKRLRNVVLIIIAPIILYWIIFLFFQVTGLG